MVHALEVAGVVPAEVWLAFNKHRHGFHFEIGHSLGFQHENFRQGKADAGKTFARPFYITGVPPQVKIEEMKSYYALTDPELTKSSGSF